MQQIDQIANRVKALKDKIKIDLESINTKHDDLFGGDAYGGFGKAERLLEIANRCGTAGMFIPEKQLVIDTMQDLEELFNLVIETFRLTKNDFDSYLENLSLIKQEWSQLKLNEMRYNDNLTALDKENKRLRSDNDELIKLGGYNQTE